MPTPSENVERRALADLHASASTELATSLALSTLTLDASLVSVAGALPDSAIVVNRAIGVGLDRPATREGVAAMARAYEAADVGRYFVQVHPAATPASLTGWLDDAGLEQARGWQKFRRGRAPVPETPTDLSVEEIGPERGPDFGRIVCDAFDLGPLAVPWLAGLPGRAGWRIFMSFDGDQPAGAGALFIDGGVAWTDFGATAPAFRRRGSQAAVLARRVRCALESGCQDVFTCTGEDVPGDPQHSYRNIKKLGFEETYVRANYAPRRP